MAQKTTNDSSSMDVIDRKFFLLCLTTDFTFALLLGKQQRILLRSATQFTDLSYPISVYGLFPVASVIDLVHERPLLRVLSFSCTVICSSFFWCHCSSDKVEESGVSAPPSTLAPDR